MDVTTIYEKYSFLLTDEKIPVKHVSNFILKRKITFIVALKKYKMFLRWQI